MRTFNHDDVEEVIEKTLNFLKGIHIALEYIGVAGGIKYHGESKNDIDIAVVIAENASLDRLDMHLDKLREQLWQKDGIVVDYWLKTEPRIEIVRKVTHEEKRETPKATVSVPFRPSKHEAWCTHNQMAASYRCNCGSAWPYQRKTGMT